MIEAHTIFVFLVGFFTGISIPSIFYLFPIVRFCPRCLKICRVIPDRTEMDSISEYQNAIAYHKSHNTPTIIACEPDKGDDK